MIEKLQKIATGRLVWFLFGITIFVYLIILFYSIPSVTQQSPEMRLFDMSPSGYTHAYAKELLDSIGSTGRERYLKLQLPIDFIYPGLFAVTYSLMLIWLFGKRFNPQSKVFYLALIPMGAGLFDYFENLGIILMLKSFPNLNPFIVELSSVFSILKSAFTIGFYFLLCFGLISLYTKKNTQITNK